KIEASGMRVGTVDRVRRQLLREAVTDNVETIRGLPPRFVHPARRAGRAWLGRLPLLLLPLTLIGASYLISGAPTPPAATPLMRTPLRAAALHTATIDSFEPVKAAAFPFAVRRVVLDAGHGGKDAGAQALPSIAEKDITLDIEQRLGKLLRQNGFEVVVTRTD